MHGIFILFIMYALNEEEVFLWKHHENKIASLCDTINKHNKKVSLSEDFNAQLHDEVVSLK
jgi:hypothetical protein